MGKKNYGSILALVVVVLLFASGLYFGPAKTSGEKNNRGATSTADSLALSIDELTAPVLTVNYNCADDKSFIARIEDRPAGAAAEAEVWLDLNQKVLLSKQVSTSGELYQDEDEMVSFWIKGDTASVEVSGRPFFSDCRAGE